MKKVFATALVLVAIIGTAAVALAENGSIWPVVKITERGCVGGVGCGVTK